ncbi:hypothetical protein KR093_009855 [Drosophila rubida]|uniref:Interference hedgehog n=1 Tax=Drosophila rubida TaxID=30044 RepID=A0AAD4PSM4_9MUSC|nr:hypothetical protein KR093_009855 [Drosophila rubida]
MKRLLRLSLPLALTLAVLSLCCGPMCTASGSGSGSSSGSSSSNLLGVYIERGPESAVAPKGDEVVFECEMNLKPDRLEWRFRYSVAEAYRHLRPAAGYNVTSSNEERTWKLRIYVSAQTVGDDQCVAWYGPGAIASTPARLTLVSIALDEAANGYGRHAVRWSVAPKNCVLLRSGSDAGNYTCAATNVITGEELRLPQVIDLRVDYTDRTPPYFLLQQPATQLAARPGDTVVLECPGVGSPRPSAVWSSPNVPNIYHNRSRLLAYGLQISDVQPSDQGSYVCRLDNGIAPVLVHMIKLSVLERPRILRGPSSTLTNEGDALTLDCAAVGHPQPQLYWLLNGEDASADNETEVEHGRLIIRHVQKRHAGVVQCFARNQLGETSKGNLLRVNPLQINGEDDQPLGNVPQRFDHEPGHVGGNAYSSTGSSSSSSFSSSSRNKNKRKYMRVANMVPPSRPNVTRLADDEVMLRWNVPSNDGLPIQFFKVQYRQLGGNSRKIPRESWQTTNDNISYGKQQRDHQHHVKNFTTAVKGLRPDRNYRFRIIAVYSNNDNKEGNTSIKFFLQRGTAKSNLPVPQLHDIVPHSESAIQLHWTLATTSTSAHIDGYYAYYRPAASAAEYLKATVEGGNARQFQIEQLDPGTAYEFKLQSFNAHAASEFSEIKQARTLKTAGHASTAASPAIVPLSKTTGQDEQHSMYPVIAGAAGGGLLLLIATVVACLCLRRRSNAPPEDENKPQLDHIQADFVSSGVLGVAPHHNHKAGDVRRLNGVIPRMNITPNPLAQDPTADKNRNVMELRFLPPPNGLASHASAALATAEHSNREAAAVAGDNDRNADANADAHSANVEQTGASSSCETLEACDSATPPANTVATTEAPSKPLPPLPKKTAAAKAAQQQQNNALAVAAAAALHQPGLHHAQPYHAPGTPTMLQKRLPPASRDFQQLQAPPVPPHAAYYAQQQQQATCASSGASPMLDQQRRTLERSVRSLQQQQQQQQQAMGYGLEEALATPTRIPSLRRQRRASGSQHNSHSNLNNHHHNNNNNNNNNSSSSNNNNMNSSNNNLLQQLPLQHPHHHLNHNHSHNHNHHHHNGGVGIPIVPGSPRVQRSPMPARALIKRTRLGSHTDNISSGSLNSIEV